MTYAGATDDAAALAAAATLETSDVRRVGRIRYAYLDIDLQVGGAIWSMNELIYSVGNATYSSSYDITLDRAAGTLTFAVRNVAGLAPDDLASVTLRFASAFNGVVRTDRLFDYINRTALIAWTATTAGGEAFDVTVGADPVPIPGAVWLFASGLGAAGAARRSRLRL